MSNKILSLILALALSFSIISPVSAQTSIDYPVYIVQPGDTLLTIAARFGVPLTDIINLNRIQDQDFLSPGDSLLIPDLPEIQGTLTTVTVQIGETLDSFAQTYNASKPFIILINRITSPSEIYAGASLIIPVVDPNSLQAPYQVFRPDETLLEAAALSNVNPWQLTLSNQIQNSTSILPGSLFFKKLAEGEKSLNPFDAALTKVFVDPLPLMQGQTFEVKVDSSLPVTLEGTLAGNQLAFFSNGENKFLALQGIHAMSQPGIYTFTLEGKYGNGKGFSFSQPVLLISGNYPKDTPLEVDPSTIDPTVTKPEDDFVKNLVSILTPIKYWNGIFVSPSTSLTYTSVFGVRRSFNGSDYTYFHSGLDFGGGVGLPITAPADGVVVFAGPLTVRGNATFIDHGWGVYSGFFHQSEIDVKVGDKVTKGQTLGLVGNTGRVNGSNEYPGAGAHLHWEVWVNGVQVNPFTWLNQQYP